MKARLVALLFWCLMVVAGRAHAASDDLGYDASSSSAATVTVAPPPASDLRRMGWFGMGARIGVTQL